MLPVTKVINDTLKKRDDVIKQSAGNVEELERKLSDLLINKDVVETRYFKTLSKSDHEALNKINAAIANMNTELENAKSHLELISERYYIEYDLDKAVKEAETYVKESKLEELSKDFMNEYAKLVAKANKIVEASNGLAVAFADANHKFNNLKGTEDEICELKAKVSNIGARALRVLVNEQVYNISNIKSENWRVR